MSDDVKPSSPVRMDWFLLVLLAVSLTGNVLLGYGVFRLSERVGAGVAQAGAPARAEPKVGARLPALDVQNVQGERVSLSFDSESRPTVIYVFTPECTWCARNLNNLKTVLAAARSSYRFVGLSLSPDVTDYLKTAGLDFPVYVKPSRQVVEAFGLASTPSTLVVSSDGVLLKYWKGAYASANKTDVQAFFHVSLPGLTNISE